MWQWTTITSVLTEWGTLSPLYWISDTEYGPSGNSNLSCHVWADILNLFLYDFLYFSLYS